MRKTSRVERKKQIEFAVGIAAIDGGKPNSFTQHLLTQYEHGQITSAELKQAIVQYYQKTSNNGKEK